MNRSAETAVNSAPRRRWLLAAAGVALAATALTGCGTVSKAVNAVKTAHDILHGSSAIDSLTTRIKTGDASAYEVTYLTTGSSPATIEYAASPPNGFAFDETSSDSHLDVFQGPAGQFACNRPQSSTSAWSCLKLQGAQMETYKAMYALYSGSYWIDFLKMYSVAAALHGVTITSSTMTVNGFNLQCADVRSGRGSKATESTWCVTSSGVLGYVKTSADSTAFEIKSYGASPPSSLFAVPSGATVGTIPDVTTTTT